MSSKLIGAGPNPFHKTQHLSRGKASPRHRSWHAGMAGWILLAALLGALCGGLLFARFGPGSPKFLQGLLLFQIAEERVFAPGKLDQETARRRYAESLAALEAQHHEAALAGFQELEAAYPGLKDLLILHQAEAYAGQGNEAAAQQKLQTLLHEMPQSAVRPTAQYRLAQSHYRASEREKAESAFEQTRRDYPQSDTATGSLYYLGKLTLAGSSRSPAKAAGYFRGYLRQCPDCRFSGEAAHELDQLEPHPDAEGHLLIGSGYGHAGLNNTKAISYLKQAPLEKSWLLLGQLQLRNGQQAAGVQTLMDGLPYAKDTEAVQQAVDWIVRYSPGNQGLSRLNTLKARNLKPGGDYVLWKLAQLNPGQGQSYYQAILDQYPQGDYAPESGWLRLWPLLAGGNRTAFIQQAQSYLARYPYGKAAPKAMFWLAKSLEPGNPAEATRAYQHLASYYPESYYAFRASGRLKVLAEGKEDPGWRLPPPAKYPPSGRLAELDMLPPAEMFHADARLGGHYRAQAAELQAIGAVEDMRLLVKACMPELPPAVESWVHHANGDRAQGIRTIRDALEQEARKLRQQNPKAKMKLRPDELKLLYPIYFEADISRQAARHGLDPFLVQSLMREESYFNELAVSSSNAYGLMQLLPSTAKEVAGWEGMAGFKATDLFIPSVNVRLGTRYLGHLHQLFSRNGMLAVGSYNGGPGAMKRWASASPYLASDPDMFVERIPYEQTRDYIKKVYGSYWNYHRLYGNPGR